MTVNKEQLFLEVMMPQTGLWHNFYDCAAMCC